MHLSTQNIGDNLDVKYIDIARQIQNVAYTGGGKIIRINEVKLIVKLFTFTSSSRWVLTVAVDPAASQHLSSSVKLRSYRFRGLKNDANTKVTEDSNVKVEEMSTVKFPSTEGSYHRARIRLRLRTSLGFTDSRSPVRTGAANPGSRAKDRECSRTQQNNVDDFSHTQLVNEILQ